VLPVMTISGQRKLFQEAMNARIATVATAGMDRGIQIRQYLSWLGTDLRLEQPQLQVDHGLHVLVGRR